ncbi:MULTISPECIES: TPM domain-containing protein [unclassified Lactobacillus]|uniref:TPM domain-containing protein n=1 Tax=unclassified Lactobacillus TaxID=2620435 RepID=UPI000EFC235E|nr:MULTISPECIES: TPM domain-containing protein [unclassified Lactobacillus]RMC23666.1 TPM domain-containing protein [Lactobacillus sp. ESL0247]RMC27426.1 TPM domain-containing protein [Lactobacillus sp. ESL0246]RMC30627.1 TPM domain-containing protein [Lactobacillus sp. ESL0245]RMC47669.1 TPM domain-containing protein [Lactobacillus sp. ESL0228]
MLKTKIAFLVFLAAIFLNLTAFSSPNIKDKSNLLERETTKLITAKNNRYFQTSEQPKIIVETVNRIDHLTPQKLTKSKRSVFIVVGSKNNKRNVQIYSSKDLHGAFTADVRSNIIRSQSDALRSSNRRKFNQGLRFVFRACATTIDQKYQYSLDKYDLTNQERDQIAHPRRVALPIAFALVIIIGCLVYFFKNNLHLKNK